MTPDFSPKDAALLREMQLRKWPDPKPEPEEKPESDGIIPIQVEIEDGEARLAADTFMRLLAANHALASEGAVLVQIVKQWRRRFYVLLVAACLIETVCTYWLLRGAK